MLIYLLKSSACLAILMLFYKLFLERSSIHHFKRFYLLAALLLAFTIPKITFVEYIEPVIYNFKGLTAATETAFTEALPQENASNLLSIILWTLYATGVLIFLFKFCVNLFRIYSSVQHNPTCKSKGFIQVLIESLITPHTFFNYIFLNKSKFETNQIPREVLLHEETHARQKHSIDVVILELFQIVFWFNPLIYILKNDIKLNHEFLADQAVLKNGYQTATYQSILLAFSSKASHQHLANAINYSSTRQAVGMIKKRFTVMKTQSTPKSIWLRSLLILPLLAFLFYGFTQREQVVKNNANLTENAIENVQQQKGATKAQLAEYNKLAKHYNTQADDNRVIKMKDMERLNEIYAIMTKEQKSNAEPLPNFPPPPPPPLVGAKNNIKKLPPPPPPPRANATTAQKNAYKKAIEDYENQNHVYTYKNKEGESVTVTVIPDSENLTPPPPTSKTDQSKIDPLKEKVVVGYGVKNRKKTKEQTQNTNKNANEPITVEGYKTKEKSENYSDNLPAPPPPPLPANPDIVEAPMNPQPPEPPQSLEGLELSRKAAEAYAISHPESISKINMKNGTTQKIVEMPIADPFDVSTKFINIEGLLIYAVSIDGKTKYYNAQGFEVNDIGQKISKTQVNASDVIPGQYITTIYKDSKVMVEFKDNMEQLTTIYETPSPPTPPKPLSPLELIRSMAKSNAEFYFEKELISSEKAMDLLKRNKELNIQVKSTNSKTPLVYITKAPIGSE